EGDEHQCSPGDKSRPGRGHAPMADVRPEVETKALRDDFPSTDPDDPRFGFLLARAGGHLVCISSGARKLFDTQAISVSAQSSRVRLCSTRCPFPSARRDRQRMLETRRADVRTSETRWE